MVKHCSHRLGERAGKAACGTFGVSNICILVLCYSFVNVWYIYLRFGVHDR